MGFSSGSGEGRGGGRGRATKLTVVLSEDRGL